jgi:hypothetical protein
MPLRFRCDIDIFIFAATPPPPPLIADDTPLTGEAAADFHYAT